MAIPSPMTSGSFSKPPNYVHLSTLRTDGSPRNWVVWAGLEDDYILVCTSDAIAKAKDMRRDPRVALSLTDITNPYRMAAIQGPVVEGRSDEGCNYMDPISFKYTNAPFPSRAAAVDLGDGSPDGRVSCPSPCPRYSAAFAASSSAQRKCSGPVISTPVVSSATG